MSFFLKDFALWANCTLFILIVFHCHVKMKLPLHHKNAYAPYIFCFGCFCIRQSKTTFFCLYSVSLHLCCLFVGGTNGNHTSAFSCCNSIDFKRAFYVLPIAMQVRFLLRQKIPPMDRLFFVSFSMILASFTLLLH